MLLASPRRREWLVGLSAPILLIAMFAAGEVLLRLDQMRRFGTTAATETEVEARIWESIEDRRRPRPSAIMGPIRFSPEGFRGPPLVMPKPAGTVRLGFFGSSTTFDFDVPDDAATWPAIAVGVLRKAYPNCVIDYFNAGVPGYDVQASLGRFGVDARPLQPDVAFFLLNDVNSRSRDQLKARGIEIKAYKPNFLGKHSILWDKVAKNYASIHYRRIASRPEIAKRLDLGALATVVRADADQVIETVLQSGALPVMVENAPKLRRSQSREEQVANALSRVLYMPGVFIEDITESSYTYNEQLRSSADAHGVPFIATLAQMPSDDAYYVDSSHTTRLGSKVYGELVGHAMAADPRVVKRLNDRGDGCATRVP